METYLESQRHNLTGRTILETLDFSWYQELYKRDINWSSLKELAKSWVTCACGHQCAIIPRQENGVPIDSELAELGSDFYEAISLRNTTQAIRILQQIEKRSTFLIQQIQNANL